MDPVRLPGIPVNSLPDLVHTGLSHDARQEETVLTKIAVTENSLIGLTNKGHVLRYTRLFNENSYLLGLWEYVSIPCTSITSVLDSPPSCRISAILPRSEIVVLLQMAPLII